MKRMMSLDSHAMRSALRPASCSVSDLTRMSVRILELRHDDADRTWLYALEVRCGAHRWELERRYSEIREFWVALCDVIAENHDSCSERCHFLAGLQGDKFPKKKLLHTRAVLEDRANELDAFFRKLVMRLNLCNQRELADCHAKGCSTLALLASFFEVQALKNDESPEIDDEVSQPETTMESPSMPLRKSMPLIVTRSKDSRYNREGRMSLVSLTEVRSA
ncbi:hypothetical protein ATCC90586_000892 [Pythium insidiosum]|nr:hypothetical protein ATCC90586_000892 [Pythium insidiosum]